MRSEASWPSRIAVATLCFASIALLCALLAFVSNLFGSNYDTPPTWYAALTALIILIDVAAISYIAFAAISFASGRRRVSRVLRAVLFLTLLLALLNSMTAYAFSKIPQWDFQDSLFDDLSWSGPGRISQDCVEATTSGSNPQPVASSIALQSVERPASLEDIKQIASISDWRARYSELASRRVAGWHAWVQDVSKHGYYSNPDSRLIILFLHDPYVPAGLTQPPEATVSYFNSSDVGKLSVGQEVLVCGKISDATVHDGELRISISSPVVSPLPLPQALASIQIPSDFLLEYEAHGCGDGYECAEYDITVDADGIVTYTGLANVPVTGTHTIKITDESLKQLVFELQRTAFLEVDNLPQKLKGDSHGATVISVRMDGISKTVALPWQGPAWPNSISMIIGKLEEVSDLQQWVKLVTSP